jgi:hypothetical protein
MDIHSLSEQIRLGKDGLYDLFRPTIISFNRGLNEYVVKREEEMRIDLLFQNIYELLPDSVSYYYKDIDVLLAINNIDNPMNIKEGMVIKYPPIGELESYRYGESERDKSKESSIAKLGVPNKKTKQDPSRSKYVKDNFSLPPTANQSPKQPITFDDKNNKLYIGGL